MSHVKPLLDADILPMAILAGKTNWFVSASYPAKLGVFGGIYYAAEGDSVEECVAKILAQHEQQWGGL